MGKDVVHVDLTFKLAVKQMRPNSSSDALDETVCLLIYLGSILPQL